MASSDPRRLAARMAVIGLGIWPAVTIPAADDGYGIHAELVWTSIYMGHGFNASRGEPALQPCLILDTRIPGLSFKSWSSWTCDRDEQATDAMDFIIQYERTLAADRRWATTVCTYLDRWIKPHSPSATPEQEAAGLHFRHAEGWKAHCGLTLPNIGTNPIVDLVPSWGWYHWAPVNPGQFEAGSVDEVKLTLVRRLGQVLGTWRWTDVRLATSTSYQTGFRGVEPGWSHSVVQLTGSGSICRTAITATANYQRCWEPLVNPQADTWWWSMGLGWAF